VRLGFIGAGNYATSMLLPHLRDNSGVQLVSVATTKALSGLNAQRKFGFTTISTSVDSVLDEDNLDAVFIVTRHHSHAGFVCQALERGLTVFVEKPLALSDEQLTAVLDTVESTGNDRLMVGFNRRFAPLFSDLQQRFGPSRGPVSARYLINAGRLDAGSWYLNEELEGSRFAGEGGHFIDALSALVGHHPVETYATGTEGNVHATLRFADESVATVSYVTDGSSRFPKESLDLVGDGRNGRLDNFQRVTVWSAKGKSGHRALSGQDKGQRAQLEHFIHAVRTGSTMPIPLRSLVATNRATLAIESSLSSRKPVMW
jgi:predicted dehydrogenase